eukprot:2717556-Rhodomonas_salina.1
MGLPAEPANALSIPTWYFPACTGLGTEYCFVGCCRYCLVCCYTGQRYWQVCGTGIGYGATTRMRDERY